ncbi:MAG: GNAT family N-acetyltransferase [Ruminococcaceae bacterium]|nr:GNAT family N-acetyltransferase [Oscillospiraceae bacterium]
MNIYGQKVMLRAMEPQDMEMLRGMVNDPDIERMVGGWSFPISQYEQMKWYERVVGDNKNLRFIIETLDTHEAIGMINLVDIDWKNRKGFHGIKLKSDAPKGQGYAKDAVMALEWYAFEELQLNRLDGSCIEYNIPSQKLYEKCGVKVEGIQRKAVYRNGQYYDVQYTGVLREDYFEAKEKMGWKPYGQK